MLGSELDLRVYDGDNFLRLESELRVSNKKEQVRSLVKFAVNNILDSAVNYFGLILMESFKRTQFDERSRPVQSTTKSPSPDERNVDGITSPTYLQVENRSTENCTDSTLIFNENSSVGSMARVPPNSGNTSYKHDAEETSNELKPEIFNSETNQNLLDDRFVKARIPNQENPDFPVTIFSCNRRQCNITHLVQFIQEWSDRFAGRGTGVDAVDLPGGVALTFAIDDSYTLRIEVDAESRDQDTFSDVTLRVSGNLIKSNHNTENADVSTGTDRDSSPMIKLILSATTSLLDSLRTGLSDFIPNAFFRTVSPEGTRAVTSRPPTTALTSKMRIPPRLSSSYGDLSGLAGPPRASIPSVPVSASSVPLEGPMPTAESGTAPARSAASSAQSSASSSQTRGVTGGGHVLSESVTNSREGSTLKEPTPVDPAPPILSGAGDSPFPSDTSVPPYTDDRPRDSPRTNRAWPEPQKRAGPDYKEVGEVTSDRRPFRERDPDLTERARKVGLRLENFENKGLEEQAAAALRDMMKGTRNSGLLGFLNSVRNESTLNVERGTSSGGVGTAQDLVSSGLVSVLEEGRRRSNLTLESLLSRPLPWGEDAMGGPLPHFPVRFDDSDMDVDLVDAAGGVEVVQESLEQTKRLAQVYADMEITDEDENGDDGVNLPSRVVEAEALEAPVLNKYVLPPGPTGEYNLTAQRVDMLVRELLRADEPLHEGILGGFKDVLLAEDFLYIMKQRNESCRDYSERAAYSKMVAYSVDLNTQLGLLVRTESIRHLQTIQDLCQVAVMYQHDELKFLDEVDLIRPRFDTELLSYLKFAIEEERAELAARGSDWEKDPSTWLKVLTVVQGGVIADFETRYERLLDALLTTLRFDSTDLRRAILERFIKITPGLDWPYLKALGTNMAGNLITVDSALNNLVDKEEWLVRVRSLSEHLEELLPDDVVEAKLRELESMANESGQEMVRVYRNPVKQMEAVEREAEAKELRKKYSAEAIVNFDRVDRPRAKERNNIALRDRASTAGEEKDDDIDMDMDEDGMANLEGTEENSVLEKRGNTRSRPLLGWG